MGSGSGHICVSLEVDEFGTRSKDVKHCRAVSFSIFGSLGGPGPSTRRRWSSKARCLGAYFTKNLSRFGKVSPTDAILSFARDFLSVSQGGVMRVIALMQARAKPSPGIARTSP